MTSKSVLETLENLGLELDEYRDFLDDLVENFEELITSARSAISSHHSSEASDHMHSMKGSAGSLGLQITYEKCKHLEQAYKERLDENSLAELDELIKIYKNEMIEIRNNL